MARIASDSAASSAFAVADRRSVYHRARGASAPPVPPVSSAARSEVPAGRAPFQRNREDRLHYFLTQFPSYSGHEQIFSRIRSFIYQETKEPVRRVNEFVQQRHHPLLLPMLNPDARPDGWRAHVLAAETRTGSSLAHIQMFLTRENPGLIYTINLVRDPAITEYAAHAHLYRYFSGGKQGRFSGETSSLPSVRVAMAFPPTTPAVTNG